MGGSVQDEMNISQSGTRSPDRSVSHRRRGSGEGSIYQRESDGRWVGTVDLGWEGGKRKRKSFYGYTRQEVRDAVAKALEDRKKGLPIAVERQTLEQFLDRWLTECVQPSVKPLTYEQYAQHARLYIKPALGKIQLSKLSPAQLQTFITAQLKRPFRVKVAPNAKPQAGEGQAGEGDKARAIPRTLSARTVKITLFVLQRALEQAEKWGLIARNVAKLVDTPRIEKKEIQPPTREQALKLLETTRGRPLEAAFVMCLALGLRRGEVLGLRWRDIDFDAKTLSVRQQLQRSGGRHIDGARSKLRFVEPKSRASRRTLPLPEFVATALHAHRARQTRLRLEVGPEWQDLDLVFTTAKGTPIEPRRFDAEFKRLLEDSDLPATVRLHDARHFTVTLLAALGVHPRIAMAILGHSDISLTMNVYSHVVPEVVREAADKIDAALGGR